MPGRTSFGTSYANSRHFWRCEKSQVKIMWLEEMGGLVTSCDYITILVHQDPPSFGRFDRCFNFINGVITWRERCALQKSVALWPKKGEQSLNRTIIQKHVQKWQLPEQQKCKKIAKSPSDTGFCHRWGCKQYPPAAMASVRYKPRDTVQLSFFRSREDHCGFQMLFL